jgi:hypothetical protein
MNMHKIGRRAAAAGLLAALAACSGAGTLGNVLGSVLGGGGSSANQVSGYVRGVDTRSQVIAIQQPSGQSVNVLYDGQTRVVYNNQSYAVTSLDRGDQVTARIQSTNSGYYTDLVQVDQPVQGSAAVSSGNVQTLQGSVRQIDQQNGAFTMDVGNGSRVLVTMPYSARSSDINRFQNLRAGDYVRIAGTILNSSRVELRQFY